MDTLAVMHPWLAAEVDAVTERFGGDPFAYGFGANLHVLEALAGYSHEQGLSSRLVDPREVFAPETHDWVAPAGAEPRA